MRGTLRRFRFLLAFVLTFAAMLGSARLAQAQASITIVNESSLPRLDKDGKTVAKRRLALSPEGVSLQDCVDDQKIRFTLQMSGFEQNAEIQVWAAIGQDCKQATLRGGGTQQCWRVLDGTVSLQQTISVDIPVRRIMAGAPPFQPLAAQETADAFLDRCGKVNLANVAVQFLYFAPGNPTTAASSKDVAVQVDTVGPLPPSGLSVLPGDTRIAVRWNNISGAGGDSGAAGGLTELTGVNVYCDVAGAGETTVPAEPICREEPVEAGPDADPDAGQQTVQVCEDGGTITTPSNDACSSSNLVKADGSKVFPTAAFDAKFKCGSFVGNTGTGATADTIAGNPLVNGTRYAVAIGATDKFGNVGELSPVQCEIPEVTTDFWTDYRKANGGAGDGCATGGDIPVGSTAALGIGATVVLSSMLRRRKNRERERAARHEGNGR
jgi:uncharacterized protein (TIGR03382 family)